MWCCWRAEQDARCYFDHAVHTDARGLNIAGGNLLTLYVPKCSTTQGKLASLPTATVTLGMGWANLGSSIITVKEKQEPLFEMDQYKDKVQHRHVVGW